MIVSGTFGLIGIEDGIGYEDIFTLTTGGTAPSKPASENVNDYVPSGWYASPQYVTSTKRYQWVCKRSKKNGTWSAWSTPVEYNRYVEDGQDGTDGTDGTDGVGYEYCYKATQYNVRPDIPTSEASGAGIPTGWSSSAPDISAVNAYIWESYRTVQGSSRSYWQTPKLKNRWANDGANGAKGAKMRMRTWESGVNYLQGAEGEEFYDIVVYGTQLYLCTKSHTSEQGSNDPSTSISGYLGYWESAQQWTFIATQLLIAGKIVTDKITADLIDADGITAKDVDIEGKITATSGTFENVTIKGKLLTPFTYLSGVGYPPINPGDPIRWLYSIGSETIMGSNNNINYIVTGDNQYHEVTLPTDTEFAGMYVNLYNDGTGDVLVKQKNSNDTVIIQPGACIRFTCIATETKFIKWVHDFGSYWD